MSRGDASRRLATVSVVLGASSALSGIGLLLFDPWPGSAGASAHMTRLAANSIYAAVGLIVGCLAVDAERVGQGGRATHVTALVGATLACVGLLAPTYWQLLVVPTVALGLVLMGSPGATGAQEVRSADPKEADWGEDEAAHPPAARPNGLAQAALLCGVLAVATFGVAGIIGLLCGLLALDQIGRRQGRESGVIYALAGLLLSAGMIAVMALYAEAR
jgi:hypothetical protein